MARDDDGDRAKRANKGNAARDKKKACICCKEDAGWIDYKDVDRLRRYTSDRGRIWARRVTGNCVQHQREVQEVIKTARELALLPYAQRSISERGPRRAGAELVGAEA
ncbi:MAG: 30S ribosomal protein S18 [Acidimicrobiales bacterium]